jgi:type VI protein secretion system component VasK
MGLKDYMTSYYVGLVFCALAAATLLIFVVILLIAFMPLWLSAIGDCCSNCCASVRRWKQRKHEAMQERKQQRQERKAEQQRQKEEQIQQKQLEQMESQRQQEQLDSTNNIYAVPPTIIQPTAPPAINVLSQSQFAKLSPNNVTL